MRLRKARPLSSDRRPTDTSTEVRRIRSRLGCAVDGHRWALIGHRCVCLRCGREAASEGVRRAAGRR
jgi:hypothetical protein